MISLVDKVVHWVQGFGFGKNLFQVKKGLCDNEDVVHVVNIIKSKKLHRLIGWTDYEPTILTTTFVDDVVFI